MAATVAGRVALGFGVTPKVSPRCTGAVEGLTWIVLRRHRRGSQGGLRLRLHAIICGLACHLRHRHLGFHLDRLRLRLRLRHLNDLALAAAPPSAAPAAEAAWAGICGLIFGGGGGVVGTISSVIS